MVAKPSKKSPTSWVRYKIERVSSYKRALYFSIRNKVCSYFIWWILLSLPVFFTLICLGVFHIKFVLYCLSSSSLLLLFSIYFSCNLILFDHTLYSQQCLQNWTACYFLFFFLLLMKNQVFIVRKWKLEYKITTRQVKPNPKEVKRASSSKQLLESLDSWDLNRSMTPDERPHLFSLI